MVSKSDVKYRKSNNSGRGESMSGTDIVTNTDNNYFDLVTASDQIGGHIEYRCMYITNGHATEKMEDCDVWLSADNRNSGFSTVKWAIDPIAQNPVWPFHPSLFFDGNGDKCDWGNHASLWSQSLSDFSFTFWIFPTAAGDGTDRYVLNHGGSSNLAFRVLIDATFSTRIRFLIKDAVGANHEAYSDSLKLNQWNYIAVVFDDARTGDEMRIFVDNVLGAGTADTPDVPNFSASLDTGTGSTDSYSGYIKDIRFFLRDLSIAEIDDIMHGQDEAATPDWWMKLEEGTGTPTDEKTAKTGTLSGNAEWRTAQEVASSTTSPLGISWLGVTNGPVNPSSPNLGDLDPNFDKECPVWIQWTVQDTEQDAAGDYCDFTVQGKIPQGGTSPPPDPDDPNPPSPPSTADNFTFCATGDWGCDSETSDVVSEIKSKNPKVVISLGDTSYSSSVGCWFDKIKSIDDNQGASPKFEIVFGNHDNAEDESDSTEDNLRSHFKYSKTYNSFTYQNVHFILLNNTTEISFGGGSAQAQFAESDLKAARADPDVDWLVACFHKPVYGADSKHDVNEGNFAQTYWPIFEKYKVDLFLSGHNHNWQFCKQAKYKSSDPENPTIVDSSSPYVGGAGAVQVVAGSGGHGHYSASSNSETTFVEDGEDGPLVVDVSNSGSTTTMTLKFVNVDGSTKSTIVINR